MLRRALAKAGLPEDAVALVEDGSHETAVEFMRLRGIIDCLVPRGGPALIASLLEHATVPYVLDGDGNCHVYVDAAADLAMAADIVVNAKTQRPGVCNAAESLLVHAAVAPEFLPVVQPGPGRGGAAWATSGSGPSCPGWRRPPRRTSPREFLGLNLSVAVVDDLTAAVDHIDRFGSGHSEAIVTADLRRRRPLRPRGGRGGGGGERLHPLRRRRRARAGGRGRASPPRSCTPGARWGCAS